MGIKTNPYTLRRARPWLVRWIHPRHGGQTRGRYRSRQEATRGLARLTRRARRPDRFRIVHVSSLRGF